MVSLLFLGIRIINTKDLVLPGEHNLENILAAVLASIIAGVPVKAIVDSLVTFPVLIIDFSILVQIAQINIIMIQKQLIL